MNYPTRCEVTKALRALLSKYGALRSDAACSLLADHFSLSEEQKNKTRDEHYGDGRPGTLWANLVQWARADLKYFGELALSSRGVWMLNEAGRLSAEIDVLIAEVRTPNTSLQARRP